MSNPYEESLLKCFTKVDHMLPRMDGFPHITKNGDWLKNQNGHWTGGFWTGILWLESIYCQSAEMEQEAKKWALKLQCRQNDATTHDLGFLFGPSCVLGHRITGDCRLLPLIHAGSKNLQKQYVPQVGLVQAWAEAGYEGISIVDTIMNLPITWISGKLRHDSEAQQFCLHVAEQIRRYAVREDGSTYHVVRWDENYHISGDTHQGYSSTSCWSRGQAWALYGFANMYRYTHAPIFLETAEKTACYFWEHLNADYLPAWDFVFQNENVPIDAAAASIAASGMELLAYLFHQKGALDKAELWEMRSEKILDAEIEHCLYRSLDKYGLIENVTVDLPNHSGIGESSMYGDYYFVEALFRKVFRNNEARLLDLY